MIPAMEQAKATADFVTRTRQLSSKYWRWLVQQKRPSERRNRLIREPGICG